MHTMGAAVISQFVFSLHSSMLLLAHFITNFIIICTSVWAVSELSPTLPNGTQTRTWKYLGYYLSKVQGAAFKLSNAGNPPNNAQTQNPQIPQANIPIFTISPDTAIFPTFPTDINMIVVPTVPNSPPPLTIVPPIPSNNPPVSSSTSLPVFGVDTPVLLPSLPPGFGNPPLTIVPPSNNSPTPSLPVFGVDTPVAPPSLPPGSGNPLTIIPPSPSSDNSPLSNTVPQTNSMFTPQNDPSPFQSAPPPDANSIGSLPVFTSNLPESTAPLPTGLTGTVLATSKNMIPVAQAPTTTTNSNGVVQCSCVPAGACVPPQAGQGSQGGVISVRIVTPSGSVNCPTGQQYCCVQTSAPQTTSCGLPNVISGVFPSANQANFGQFPWSGIIMTAQNQFVGGAALIDNTHLLTAAHLVASYGNGQALKVRLGEWDITGTYEPQRHVDIGVQNIVIHPNFVSSTLQNDIAVITLQSAATLLAAPTPQVNTVCLPAANDDFTGQTCFVAGWGKDSFTGNLQNIIKVVDVPVLPNNDCQQRLRQTRLGPQWNLDTTSFVCAGGVGSKDSCQGDGGTALACLRGGRFYVAGITAGGVECGLNNVPGLYVRVVSYLPWINAQLTPTQGGGGGIDPRRQGGI